MQKHFTKNKEKLFSRFSENFEMIFKQKKRS